MNRGLSIALGSALLQVPIAYCADVSPLDRAEVNVCGRGVVHICPSTLRGDSAAILTFAGRHPRGFAIRRPDGSWVDLAGKEDARTLIKDFAELTKFDFVPKALIGTEWIDGRPNERRVFLLPGRYILYFADNMETEPENTNAMALAVEFVE